MKDYILSINDAKVKYPNIQINENTKRPIQSRGFTYLGKAFESDKNLCERIARILKFIGECSLVIFSLGILWASTTYKSLLSRHWNECKYGETVKIYVLRKIEDVQNQVIPKPPIQTQINIEGAKTQINIEGANFNSLPQEIKKTILQKLNLEDFLSFSMVNKRNLQFVKENFGHKKLQAYLETEALKTWELICKSDQNFGCKEGMFGNAVKLMESFPLHVKKTLEDLFDRALPSEENLDLMTKILGQCSESNPGILPLLEKVHDKIKCPKQSILLFMYADPVRAYEMTDLLEGEVKISLISGLAVQLFFKDQKQAFKLLSDWNDAQYWAIRTILLKILDSYNKFDNEQVLDFILQIKDFIAKQDIITDGILQIITFIYAKVNEYDKAFEILKEIKNEEAINVSRIAILLEKVNKFPHEAFPIFEEIEKCLPKIQDKIEKARIIKRAIEIFSKINYIPEKLKKQIWEMYGDVNTQKYNTTWFLNMGVKTFEPFDLKKAKEIADLVSDPICKIYLLLDIAEKYKKIDEKLATQILDEAHRLTQKLDIKSQYVEATALVARQYASIYRKKSEYLIEPLFEREKENLKVKHVDMEFDSTRLLAEVLLDVFPEDKKRVSILINNILKRVCFKMLESTRKVGFLLNISAKQDIDLSKRWNQTYNKLFERSVRDMTTEELQHTPALALHRFCQFSGSYEPIFDLNNRRPYKRADI